MTQSIGNWRAEGSLALVAFVWGATFVLVKSALDDVSALLFLALRFTLAGTALLIAYHRKLSGAFASRALVWQGGLLAGVCLFGGYAFQTLGLRFTTPSKSAFLTGMAIVMVPLLSAAFYRVAPLAAEVAGVAVAAVGMGLMTLQGADLRLAPGDALTLVGSVFFGLHIIVIGHYAPRIGFQPLSLIQVGLAAALGWATCRTLETPHIAWSSTVVAALLVTGLFATAAAFTIQAWAQQRTGPTRTALILALEPVFAWLTSFLVLREILSWRSAAGAALILAGILTVELKPLARRGHPSV